MREQSRYLLPMGPFCLCKHIYDSPLPRRVHFPICLYQHIYIYLHTVANPYSRQIERVVASSQPIVSDPHWFSAELADLNADSDPDHRKNVKDLLEM
jgi:hypothetical protein